MGMKRNLNEIGESIDDDELTPRFLKIGIAIPFGLLFAFEVTSYIIVFVILGF